MPRCHKAYSPESAWFRILTDPSRAFRDTRSLWEMSITPNFPDKSRMACTPVDGLPGNAMRAFRSASAVRPRLPFSATSRPLDNPRHPKGIRLPGIRGRSDFARPMGVEVLGWGYKTAHRTRISYATRMRYSGGRSRPVARLIGTSSRDVRRERLLGVGECGLRGGGGSSRRQPSMRQVAR